MHAAAAPLGATDPVDGCLAALAGFDLMTIPRLRLLLAHHDPVEAYAVAAGPVHAASDGGPPADLDGAGGLAGLGVPPAADRVGTSGAATTGSASSPPATRTSRPSCVTIRSRRPSCSPAATSPRWTHRRVGVVGTRNATRAGRETAGELGHGLAEAGVVVVSGLAKGIDGAAHAGALRSWRWAARRGGRQRSGQPLSTRPRPVVGGRLPTRPPPVRVAARHGARAVPLPVAQPHPRRAQRGARGGREPGARWLPDHRASGHRPRRRRDGGAGLRPQPCRPRRQPVAARRRRARHLRRGRAGGARPRLAAGRRRPPTTLGRCRAASPPRCWRCAGGTRAPLDEVVVQLGLSVADAAMALARLERTGWVHEAGGWFEPVMSWPGSS